MLNIIEQLTFCYLNIENWHKNKLSEQDANLYHERLLMQGNIITYITDGLLDGYLEYWRINRKQLSRIVLGEMVYAFDEDILTGEIALINNMWIKPDKRGTEVFSKLGNLFLERNKDAEYFIAFRNMKNNKPIQVYSRNDLIKLYTKGV